MKINGVYFGFLQKIHFKENDKFPQYNLYAYSEGHLTEAARRMKFNGAPVIFVHGNAGSYKQVRIIMKSIEARFIIMNCS